MIRVLDGQGWVITRLLNLHLRTLEISRVMTSYTSYACMLYGRDENEFFVRYVLAAVARQRCDEKFETVRDWTDVLHFPGKLSILMPTIKLIKKLIS